MSERYIYQPFRFGRQGGVAITDDGDRHLSDKIMAVLFTAPGERVNQPDFGVGLNRVVFETLDPLTLAALEFRISEGLARDIGDDLHIDGVDVRAPEQAHGELILDIAYRRRGDRRARHLEIEL